MLAKSCFFQPQDCPKSQHPMCWVQARGPSTQGVSGCFGGDTPLPSSFQNSPPPVRGWELKRPQPGHFVACWLCPASAEGRHHPRRWAGLGAPGKLGKPRVKLSWQPGGQGLAGGRCQED